MLDIPNPDCPTARRKSRPGLDSISSHGTRSHSLAGSHMARGVVALQCMGSLLGRNGCFRPTTGLPEHSHTRTPVVESCGLGTTRDTLTPTIRTDPCHRKRLVEQQHEQQ